MQCCYTPPPWKNSAYALGQQRAEKHDQETAALPDCLLFAQPDLLRRKDVLKRQMWELIARRVCDLVCVRKKRQHLCTRCGLRLMMTTVVAIVRTDQLKKQGQLLKIEKIRNHSSTIFNEFCGDWGLKAFSG